MRSSSEVRWVRVRNTVSQATKVSDWHAIVPGHGVEAPSPGVACGTALYGQRQFESHDGVFTKEGTRHAECVRIAEDWIDGLPTSPGPQPYEEEPVRFAPPGQGEQ